ncbi:hypothetical protein BEL04_13970 [Mucilaginibacter sp. PPCGB 2223]|uniref:acyltransferase family protein n=1 Tax=Mucilaginibacter sp. PPCGB 2223 TaxID=1886027 RepID=UPI0008251E7A|nr:acyltransferase [Mucilaginibacter sp. PPCGB 2223]OCX52555.1 hypothetical protein BEL04_13970 [Mucilaginibacter sp. PPCGB 2223]
MLLFKNSDRKKYLSRYGLPNFDTAFGSTGKYPGKNFEVIDTIRFIAMCSIVWGHCNLGSETTTYHSLADAVLQSVVLQMGKIGTIIFFLISGFLIAPKIEHYTPLKFLRLRFKSTILPWLVFVVIFILLNLVNSPALKSAMRYGDLKQVLLINADIAKNSIFYFAYWFIVVFVISAVTLILLKKYANTLRMGLILGMLTLFYSVNLHYGWISVHHTKAFLGYAFFMWLGMQISRHDQKFIYLLNGTPWFMLIGGFTVSIFIACLEGFHLSRTGCADPYASIRLSNIICSLVAFGCLFKLGELSWVNKLEPRRLVYGIYLVHSILIYEMIVFYTKYFNNRYTVHGSLTLLVAEVVVFALILTASVVLVNIFNGKYTAAFYALLNSIPEKVNQLATKIAFNLNPARYVDKLSVQGAYRASRFALLIGLPCLSCFYFLSRFI